MSRRGQFHNSLVITDNSRKDFYIYALENTEIQYHYKTGSNMYLQHALQFSYYILYYNGTKSQTTTVNFPSAYELSGTDTTLFSITLNVGDTLFIKGANEKLSHNDGMYSYITATGNITIGGIFMDLLDNGTDTTTINKSYAFGNLFKGNTKLIDASDLILTATTLAERYVYYRTFNDCTNLIMPPKTIAATTLSNYCCCEMFNGCQSMLYAPELPAQTMQQWSYQYMFSNCKSMLYAPELPATTLSWYCYNGMFNNCRLIETVTLPAIQLAQYAYTMMFVNCVGLKTIYDYHENPTTWSNSYTQYWLRYVTMSSQCTFHKKSVVADTHNDTNAIPSSWTIVNDL